MAKVNIFVSSTCFDLSQVRDDIRQCILDIGHIPILSELKDFPVDTRLTNAENCINAVNNEADILVLIIGNRYGAVLESGKSITNTEFEVAVKKGIPIYTFAQKQMINLLPVWEKNPDADYSNVVDNNKVFEFLAYVRNKSGLWNFEYEKAQDIKEILKSQLSILFHDSLRIRRMIETSGHKDLFGKISSRAADILIRKDQYYEIRFLMQSMIDEIDKYRDLKNDYLYSIVLKPGQSISDFSELLSWLQNKLGQLELFVASLNRLFGTFDHFYAEPGVPSDLEGLYYISRSCAKAYSSLLELGILTKSIIVPDEYKKLVSTFSEMPKDAITQIETFPVDSLRIIAESEAKEKAGEIKSGTVISLSLKITINDDVMKRFYEEMELANTIYVAKKKNEYGI
jgi:hypothetical protein